MNHSPDTTQRFSDRVADYVRYRPKYPQSLINLLSSAIGLSPVSVVADIGSGTGISSLLFLENGNTVYGVEPNDPMRQAAESLLADYHRFQSVNGTAENTTLDGASIDVVLCAQSFHWFDRAKTKAEFSRILRKNGRIVLIWNERDNNDAFTAAFEKTMARLIPDFYASHRQEMADDEMRAFFAPHAMRKLILKNQQELDADGLKGRLLSASYVPKEGPVFKSLMEGMDTLFQEYAVGGKVRMMYETRLYVQ